MDKDDISVGRVLTRREVIALFGAAGAAVMLAACAPGTTSTAPAASPGLATVTSTTLAAALPGVAPTQAPSSAAAAMPSCVVRPELTEGPYFVDEKIERSDIRSDPTTGQMREGIPLAITFLVSQVNGNGCTPLTGAVVDVWHCDAAGMYSDVTDRSFNTKGQKWLRGFQTTDENGIARFTTIYPGWYSGRAVHIHFKIRTDPASAAGKEFTSQFFFDESITDQVHARAPYAAKGYRTIKNEGDGIYRQSGGQLLLNPKKEGEGYATNFDIALQLS